MGLMLQLVANEPRHKNSPYHELDSRAVAQKRLFLHNSQGIPNIEISTVCWRGFKCPVSFVAYCSPCANVYYCSSSWILSSRYHRVDHKKH